MGLKNTVAGLFVFCACTQVLAVVDTRAIDDVLKKPMLEPQDRRVIEEFLDNAVKQIVMTKDFSTVSKARDTVLIRRGKQPEYVQQYAVSARKALDASLALAKTLPSDRGFLATLNLLVLADSLADPGLVDMAAKYTNDPRPPIQYWAFRCLTNAAVSDKASTPDGQALASQVVEALKSVVKSGTPEQMALVAGFAGKVPQAGPILLQIADQRIAQYANWTVQAESSDTAVLKALYARIGGPGQDKAQYALRMAQLYSYAVQRLAKGQQVLHNAQKQALTSVIVEIEDKCLDPLTQRPQGSGALRKAIERGDMTMLVQEHDRLLGSASSVGELPQKVQFTYRGPSDAPQQAPLELPGPKTGTSR